MAFSCGTADVSIPLVAVVVVTNGSILDYDNDNDHDNDHESDNDEQHILRLAAAFGARPLA